MALLPKTLARLWPGRARDPLQPKASAAGPLIAYELLGEPVWSPRDYGAFAREGFMQNAIVYRSVRMIAEAAASIPLLLYDGIEDVSEHPLLELIARPSPDHTGADFFEAWYGFLLVAGNVYVEAAAVSGRVRELHVLRPDRMKVIPGLDGWPEAYEYSVGGRSMRFCEEPVAGMRPILHVRLFHPANDHYGMSPIEAAGAAIDLHNSASRWNKALLDNSARPSGALVYAARDGHLTHEQYERLKAELEQGFQGARHAGRPLLLEGGLDWKPLSLSPKDLDFLEAKNAAAREIALALGVPPMLLGIPGDNTYANFQEASRTFWRQTVLPLVNRTARAFSAWLAPSFGAGLELKPDLDQIEALSSEREALWARLEKASFLTDNEKRAAFGYGPVEGGGELAQKFNPYHDEAGRFTTAEGAVGAGSAQVAQNAPRIGPSRGRVPARLGEATPAQEARLAVAEGAAREALRRVRELDPEWRPTPSLVETVEGEIARLEGEAREAEARLAEILRNAIPNTNPSWGVNRLRKELNGQGYVLARPARDRGLIVVNPETGEEVRIMERPVSGPSRVESRQKFYNDYYYRYRSGDDQKWGEPVTIPNKK